ncbi:iron ABC transporter permease [Ignatzschineria rhizosphaerae]|uniref:Iron ABC transporter permease n=1 Tax=Ignatzschineria rhizosphaerae TaxID=2923279 RepID=A0ABY3X0F4_9GAMM|nr:iron ABC transporter permease [Ignatzschineria rhizosphaerae]UNM95241.1 iron ABC transporter permease [Ignatzschineria rhizosphaerae]
MVQDLKNSSTRQNEKGVGLLDSLYRRHFWVMIVIVSMSLLSLIIAPMFGLTFLTPWSQGSDIFWQMRVPRTLAAWLVGAGLSLSGLVFQAILRNPLAEPFTLGVAAGASLGAAIYIYFGVTLTLGVISGISFFAFIGAGLITVMIYQVNFRSGHSPFKLLLMGVILTFFISSILMLLQSLGKSSSALAMMSWMMGRLSFVSLMDLYQLLGVTILCFALIYRYLPELNLLQQGEVVALSRGVNSGRVMGLLFLIVSLMTGVFVAIAGPIGFVGMVIPHVSRKLLGADHRRLFLAVIFLGGFVLVVADTLGSMILKPAEIPVGVVTAIFGAPFFLFVLLREGRVQKFIAPKDNN